MCVYSASVLLTLKLKSAQLLSWKHLNVCLKLPGGGGKAKQRAIATAAMMRATKRALVVLILILLVA